MECYDELGTRYSIPVYCLSLPVNLVVEGDEDRWLDTRIPSILFQLFQNVSTGSRRNWRQVMRDQSSLQDIPSDWSVKTIMPSRDSPAEFSEPVEGEEGVELKVR